MTALLIVLQEFDFAETNDLVAAKNRLLHDVEEMGVAANEDGGIADVSADESGTEGERKDRVDRTSEKSQTKVKLHLLRSSRPSSNHGTMLVGIVVVHAHSSHDSHLQVHDNIKYKTQELEENTDCLFAKRQYM